MKHDVKLARVRGEGGGKGGGGGRTPVEAPDDLIADSTAYIIDVISEGEIEGWADPDNPRRNILFDGVPIENNDGSLNFEGVEFWLRTGTADQPPVPGFAAVESQRNVNLRVEQAQPISQTVTDDEVDGVRVSVGVAQLSELDTSTGDLFGAAVEFAIEMQVGDAAFVEVKRDTISGKTSSGYQRNYRLDLPELRPVTFRVRRITEDSETSNLQNELIFVSVTEIIDAKLTYPETAYVALAIPARTFGGRVPTRRYRIAGVRVEVPSNYDPVTRTYDPAIWDGTFKRAWTNNPAWIYYAAVTDPRWGLGDRVDAALVDKWSLYAIAQYCDEMLTDGKGGLAPRFTVNGVMSRREQAAEAIRKLAAAFRGVSYWGAGAIVPVQDAPRDPVKLVGNASVSGFKYSGTPRSVRHTAAVVSFPDPADNFRIKPRIAYEDPVAVARYGYRERAITLPYCTSAAEALRAAKWIVDTDVNARETVGYTSGFDHGAIRPGDRLLLSDKDRVGARLTGRVKAITPPRTLTLDAGIGDAEAAPTKIYVSNKTGAFVTLAVTEITADDDGARTVVTLTGDAPDDIQKGAVFVVEGASVAPTQFQVVTNLPSSETGFTISAIQHDPTKYPRVEQGIVLDDASPYILFDETTPPAPPEDIAVRTWFRSTPSGLVATVSWKAPQGSTVADWRVEFTDEKGRRTHIGDRQEQTIDIPLAGVSEGPYTVHIAAQSALGTRSALVSKTFQVDVETLRPATVPGFALRVVGGQAHLSWRRGAASISHYQIRFLFPGSGAQWSEAAVVEAEVTGLSAVVPAAVGTYLIKAVSVFGRESRDPATIVAEIGSIEGLNVVKDIAEDPDFAGARSAGLSVSADALTMFSDSVLNDWSTLDEVDSLGFDTGVPAAATYAFADQVDLGEVFVSRVSSRMLGGGFLISDVMNNWVTLDAVDPLSAVADDLWSLDLQVRHTPDNPADPSAIWTEWESLALSDIKARGFEFRVLFASADPAVSIALSQLSVSIDMPPRLVSGSDIDCPAEGVTVTFSPPFRERPAISADGQGLPTGARSVRTAVTASGFHQRFVDADGDGVACTFDYLAKGFGGLG